MAKGWKSINISDVIYERTKKHFEENEEELKLKYGIRSLSGFINFCIREYLKEIVI